MKLRILIFLIISSINLIYCAQKDPLGLIDAAKSGNIDNLKALINSKVNLDQQDKEGKTALWWAAYFGNEKALDLLIKAGANLQIADNTRITPLMIATENNFKNIVELILKINNSVNRQDQKGRTALAFAVEKANKDIVNMLLKHGAKIFIKGKKGLNPLTLAKIRQFKLADTDKYSEISKLLGNKILKETVGISNFLRVKEIDINDLHEYFSKKDAILDFYISDASELIKAINMADPKLADILKKQAKLEDKFNLNLLDAIFLYDSTELLKSFLDKFPNLKVEPKEFYIAFNNSNPDIINLLLERYRNQILSLRKQLLPSVRDRVRIALDNKNQNLANYFGVMAYILKNSGKEK